MNTTSKKIQIRDMVNTAVFAAVMCAVSPFAISIGPVPLSFATLAIYLAAGVLDWKLSALAVAIYVLLGAAGVPVFSNFQGGLHMLVSVTGGFIIGYIPCALSIGIIFKLFRRKQVYLLAMVIGTILLYTCGTAWFMIVTENTLRVSLAICVIPFLPGDAMKIIIAYIVAPKLRNALAHATRS